jgi:hypothetical protein
MNRTGIALILVLAVVLLAASPSFAGSAAAPPTTSVLLVLAPPVIPRSVPAQAVPSQFFARAYEQQSRLLPVLSSLKRHGRIGGFQLLPETNAIRVDAPDSPTLLLLRRLPGVTDLVQISENRLKVAQKNFRAKMLESLSNAQLKEARKSSSATANPYLQVHETFNWVNGYDFPPNTDVTVVLKDSGGNVKSTVSRTTDADGRFYAYFWEGGEGDIVQGDTVEATANGTTVTVVSDAITIDFDYANDRVFGTASPTRTIGVEATTAIACYYNWNYQEVTSDGTGNYSADFAGSIDISRRSEADVFSYDANGNAWIVWRHAPWVRLAPLPADSNGSGYALAPNDPVIVTLKNGATVKETIETPSSADGSFQFLFDTAGMPPGDTVEVSEGGTTWATIPVVRFNTNLDPNTNLVTGDAPANQPVIVSGKHYNPSNGNSYGACDTINANGQGRYSVNLGLDFIGGDSVEAFYCNADGHEFQTRDTAPYLQMHAGDNVLNGSFHAYFDGEVSILVKSAKGKVKYTGTSYAFGGRWDQYLTKNGNPITLLQGDKVTATPKATSTKTSALLISGGTLNGTVAKLTASIDLTNDRITGSTLPDAYLEMLCRHWGGWGYSEEWNTVQADPFGGYSFQCSSDLLEGDYGRAIYTDAQGYRTYTHGYSTQPTMTMVSYPAIFRRGRTNYVKYNIANGVHVEDTYLAWDSVSRPDWYYVNWDWSDCDWSGGLVQCTAYVYVRHRGKIYFRAFATVDGRFIFTSPEKSAPVR